MAGCQLLVDGGELAVIHCQDEGAIGPPACPVGQICSSGSCIQNTSVPPALGAPCLDDSDCVSGDFCLNPADFGEAGPVQCSRACCASSDCDPSSGFICWTSPQGGSGHCRAASDVGRATPGTAMPGQSCARNEDCLSGLCDTVTHGCADSCCSSTNCSAGNAVCRWGDKSSPIPGLACGSPNGDSPALTPCSTHDECESGLCVFLDGQNRCAAPCCSSRSCGAIVDNINNVVMPIACIYVEHEGTQVRACAGLLSSNATKAVGEHCTGNDECQGGLCLPAKNGEGYCSDACCTDGSCGDQALFACRPKLWNNAWALRCEPK